MYIYLIKENIDEELIIPAYKIGYSKHILKRKKELDTANSNELIIIYEYKSKTKNAKQLETALHNYFKSKHKKQEWFNLDENDIKDFLNICKKIDNNLILLEQYQNPFI